MAKSARPFYSRPCWRVLNSAIVLWLLSSIVAGGLTWLHGCISQQMSQQAARTELREKIANELEFRIQTYDRVRKVKSETSIEDGRRALDGEYPPRFIYPELNNRTVVSLLWELASLCDRRALKQNLRSLARDFNDKFAVGSKFTDSQLDEAVQTLSARLGEILPNAGYSSPIAPKKSR